MAGTSSNAPLVDVLLPAYNGSRVIRGALDSALSQDVPLRIIVVDDGSSDDSAAIARSYGSRVTVITQANRGVSSARNAGLAAGSSPFVALLDQDDSWRPGKLSRQLAQIEAHSDVGLVFTDMVIQRSDGTVVENGFLRNTPQYAALDRTALGDGAYLLPESLGQAIVRGNFISPSTALVARRAIQDIGGFDESLRLCDDADCWMRLLHRWRGISIEEPLVLSMRWGGNASLVKWDGLLHERIRIAGKAARHPDLFPPGTADYFRRERPVVYYQLGIGALHAGRTHDARQRFLSSLRARWRLVTALALLATWLPAFARRWILRAKRAAGIGRSMRVE